MGKWMMMTLGGWRIFWIFMGVMASAMVSAATARAQCAPCTETEWSVWTTVEGVDGLDFRTCRSSYNEAGGAYNWNVEWRNRYDRAVAFDFAVAASADAVPESDGRLEISAGSYACSWGLSTRDDIWVWVDCVSLAGGEEIYHRCGTLCDCLDDEPAPYPEQGAVEMRGNAYFHFGDGTCTIGVDGIVNDRISDSRSLNLMFWATETEYAGGAINGYRLANIVVGNIDAGDERANIEATVNYSEPPGGTYYLTMTLTEFVDGRDLIIDHANFNETKTFAGDDDDSGGGSCFISDLLPAILR